MVTAIPFEPPLKGVQADRHLQHVDRDACADAENWLFRNRRFTVRPGYRRVGSSIGSRPVGFAAFDSATDRGLIVVATAVSGSTPGGWFVFNKITEDWDDITEASNELSGTRTNLAQFRTFVKDGTVWLIGANGADKMKKWDAVSANYSDVGGQDRIPRCIAVAQNRLIAGGFIDGPTEIEFSADGDFESGWGTFSKALGETPGPIRAMQELGAMHVAIYKSDAIYVAAPYSPEFPFQFEPKFLWIPGPVSSLAVVSAGEAGHQYYLAEDGAIYYFDGSSFGSLGPHIQRYIASHWNESLKEACFGFWNRHQNELWFFFPDKVSGDIDRAVCISLPAMTLYPMRWKSEYWIVSAGISSIIVSTVAFMELAGTKYEDSSGRTYGDFEQDRTSVLLGRASGRIMQEGGTTDDDVEPIPIEAFFETGLSSIADAVNWLTVVRAEHMFERTLVDQEVQFMIAASQRGETPSYLPAEQRTMVLSQAPPLRTGHRVRGRQIMFRYEVDAVDEVTFNGALFHVSGRGRR